MRWIYRHAGAVVLLGAILTLVGAWFTVRLYRNIRPDFEELLPTTARSVIDLNRVADRLQSSQALSVLVFSDHPEQSKKLVIDLAREVQAGSTPGPVARVEYRIDQEVDFFLKRKALMMSEADLLRIRNYVRDRLYFEREIRNPLNIFSGARIPEPKLDIRDLERRYSEHVPDYRRFPDGFYATPDGKIRVVLVYVSGRALNVENATKVREGVDRILARLKPASYSPDIQVKFTGDIENLLEERSSLLKDLASSAVIVALLVSIAMLVFFRSLRVTLALVASTAAGAVVAFGISWFAVGYLNGNSAFLGSIVLGNGINFGIIYLARYLELRRESDGSSPTVALCTAATQTLSATLTAALAAGFSYAALMSTPFRGFRQFGVIGLIGMLCCWVSSFTLLPAFLALIDRRHPLVRPGARPPQHRFARAVAALVGRFPRWIMAASVAGAIASIACAVNHRGPIIETDTSKLRDRHSLEHGSAYYSRYVDQIFGHFLSPIILLPDSRRATREIVSRLDELKRRQNGNSLIDFIVSIDDFVPTDQAAKVRTLREIRSLLRPSVLAQLSPHDRRLAHDLLSPQAFRPFGFSDLPPSILARFSEIDGSIGKPVLVTPVFDKAILTSAALQARFIAEMREIADAVQPGTAVVGQLPLTVDMTQSIKQEGARTTLIAFLAVVGLVCVLFRRPRRVVPVLLSLCLGVAWLVGIGLAAGLKINFLNFISLPITFGIGVDYAVNIYQRYRIEREAGGGGILSALRGSGGAVALASLTTIIGYGSLLIAGNQGFMSFGQIAILGELTCLAAALLGLPAFLRYRELREEARHREGARAAHLARDEDEARPSESRAA